MSVWVDMHKRSTGEAIRKEDQPSDEVKELVTEKVYKRLSWYKQHNIGLDTGKGQGHPEIDKLLCGWKICYEMADIDGEWGLWLYKEEIRDYVILHFGKKLMKRWVSEIVDFCLTHPVV
jgi:hypothetical protein